MLQLKCDYTCPADGWQPPSITDITGIGVTIGFVVPAYLTVLILSLYYIFAFEPENDPFAYLNEDEGKQEHDGGSGNSRRMRNSVPTAEARIVQTSHEPNPVDQYFVKILRCSAPREATRTRWTHYWEDFWGKILVEWVSDMSAVQLTTGIAILISAYVNLCFLSWAHWQVIVYLSWFCSITHFASLSFLRNYLYNFPAERLFRSILTFLFLIMLLVAIVPTGIVTSTAIVTQTYNFTRLNWEGERVAYFPGVANLSSQAIQAVGFDIYSPYQIFYANVSNFAYCNFPIAKPLLEKIPGLTTSPSFVATVLWIIQLCFSFIIRLIKLHKSATSRARDITNRIALTYAGWFENKSRWHKLYSCALATFLAFRLIKDLYSSLFFEIFWLLLSVAWTTLQLFYWRGQNNAVSQRMATGNPENTPNGDNYWAFGQVLTVALLAAPFLTIAKHFFSSFFKRGQEDEQSLTSKAEDKSRMDTVPSDFGMNYYQKELGPPLIWLGVYLLTFFTVFIIYVANPLPKKAVPLNPPSTAWMALLAYFGWPSVILVYTLIFYIYIALHIEKTMKQRHGGLPFHALFLFCATFASFAYIFVCYFSLSKTIQFSVPLGVLVGILVAVWVAPIAVYVVTLFFYHTYQPLREQDSPEHEQS